MSIPIRWQLKKSVCDAYEAKRHTNSLLHGHCHFLITLVTRGCGVQTLNGKDIPFREGTMFFLSPADFHKNTTERDESYDYYGVKFAHEVLEGRLSEISIYDKLPLVVQLSESDYSTARNVFSKLIEESSADKDRLGSEIYLHALIEQLIIIALRSAPIKDGESSSEFVNKTLGYLYSHFSSEISVGKIAAFMGYTPNYFNKKFKANFGVPFAEHLRALRLSYASNLLLSSQLPIIEIAFESGFSCPEHFSRAFSKEYGSSPSAYRRNGKNTIKKQGRKE